MTIYHSERNLLQAAREGKQITEAEIRVLTDRLERLRAAEDRYRAALEQIAAAAREAPMEDGLDAGRIAREALGV